jgi:hypothetical protein
MRILTPASRVHRREVECRRPIIACGLKNRHEQPRNTRGRWQIGDGAGEVQAGWRVGVTLLASRSTSMDTQLSSLAK